MAELKINRCEVCGSTSIENCGNGVYKCRSCDATYRVDDGLSEKDIENVIHRINAFDSAERQLSINQPNFYEAERQFKKITEDYPEYSAGYWGLLRAKYGIKFERDTNGKAMPSCYIGEYEDIRKSPEYQKAVDYAETKEIKTSYENMAVYIADVAREVREKAAKFDYNIFISFKDSGQDREKMYNLYDGLRDKKYKAFFSPVSLKKSGMGGLDYEPFIFNAIEKSRALIVYGSKPEYFESVWVQNEWRRYERAIEEKRKAEGSLIVLYEGFNPKDLPPELRKKEAINFSDFNASEQIYSALERIFGASGQVFTPAIDRIHIQSGRVGKKLATAGERISTAVELGGSVARKDSSHAALPVKMRELGTAAGKSAAGQSDFTIGLNLLRNGGVQFCKQAVAFFDKSLQQNEKNGDAWLGKLCANLKDSKLYDDILSGSILNPYNHSLLNFIDDDYRSLQNSIDYARNKETGESILAFVFSQLDWYLAGKTLSPSAVNVISRLYGMCADYDSGYARNMTALLVKNISRIADSSAENAKTLLDLILDHISDMDTYLTALRNLTATFMAKGDFSAAKTYNNKAASIDKSDGTALLNSFCILNNFKNQADLIKHAKNVRDFSLLEKGLTKVAKKYAEGIISILCEAELSLMCSGQFPAAERYFDFIVKYNFGGNDKFIIKQSDYFSAMAAGGYVRFFNKILKRYPNRDTDFHISCRLKFANTMRMEELFEKAEKMYDSVLNLDDGNSLALQGKLFCLLGMKTDDAANANWDKWDNGLFERVLASFATQKEQSQFLNKMCNLCINTVKNNCKYKDIVMNAHSAGESKYNSYLGYYSSGYNNGENGDAKY